VDILSIASRTVPMKRVLSFLIVTSALIIPACSSQTPEEPVDAPPAPAPVVIPPPPPPIVDVLPQFKKNSRAFLDLAKQLDQSAATNPPPTYQAFWKDSQPLDDLFTQVFANEPKNGPGATAFDRITKIRDSLFKTKLILKNADELKNREVAQRLEAEAAKRKPIFEEAEFLWKQTPDKTPEAELELNGAEIGGKR
jgi:hypothetical protein